jgi:uncharacterized membrane protein HdeD (DUF308 family)
MVRSLSALLFWRGLHALIIGVVSVAWPDITVGAFVILFAVYAFFTAGTELLRAFSSGTAGPVFGYLFLAMLSLAAGVGALVWAGTISLALTIWIAAWALGTGVVEVMMTFRQEQAAGERALWALTGPVAFALGVVVLLRPDLGAVSLARVFGLFSIVCGASALVLAAQARHLGKALSAHVGGARA